ncbi:MAG: hypothetical protein N4A49_16990 [Marinifilaceae bacterium]|jgi:hypothetical protein|nr:hypothetical protein [Marinifilaceae bacterium]
MKKTFIIFLIVVISNLNLFCQSKVIIGDKNDKELNKSILDLNSDNKGLLLPRLTSEQREAMFDSDDITAQGMLVFDINIKRIFYWTGQSWTFFSDEGLLFADKEPTGKFPAGSLYFNTTSQKMYIFVLNVWTEVNNPYDELQTLSEILSVSNSAGMNVIKDVASPSDNQDLATKEYVDFVVAKINGSETKIISGNVNVTINGKGTALEPYEISFSNVVNAGNISFRDFNSNLSVDNIQDAIDELVKLINNSSDKQELNLELVSAYEKGKLSLTNNTIQTANLSRFWDNKDIQQSFQVLLTDNPGESRSIYTQLLYLKNLYNSKEDDQDASEVNISSSLYANVQEAIVGIHNRAKDRNSITTEDLKYESSSVNNLKVDLESLYNDVSLYNHPHTASDVLITSNLNGFNTNTDNLKSALDQIISGINNFTVSADDVSTVQGGSKSLKQEIDELYDLMLNVRNLKSAEFVTISSSLFIGFENLLSVMEELKIRIENNTISASNVSFSIDTKLLDKLEMIKSEIEFFNNIVLSEGEIFIGSNEGNTEIKRFGGDFFSIDRDGIISIKNGGFRDSVWMPKSMPLSKIKFNQHNNVIDNTGDFKDVIISLADRSKFDTYGLLTTGRKISEINYPSLGGNVVYNSLGFNDNVFDFSKILQKFVDNGIYEHKRDFYDQFTLKTNKIEYNFFDDPSNNWDYRDSSNFKINFGKGKSLYLGFSNSVRIGDRYGVFIAQKNKTNELINDTLANYFFSYIGLPVLTTEQARSYLKDEQERIKNIDGLDHDRFSPLQMSFNKDLNYIQFSSYNLRYYNPDIPGDFRAKTSGIIYNCNSYPFYDTLNPNHPPKFTSLQIKKDGKPGSYYFEYEVNDEDGIKETELLETMTPYELYVSNNADLSDPVMIKNGIGIHNVKLRESDYCVLDGETINFLDLSDKYIFARVKPVVKYGFQFGKGQFTDNYINPQMPECKGYFPEALTEAKELLEDFTDPNLTASEQQLIKDKYMGNDPDYGIYVWKWDQDYLDNIESHEIDINQYDIKKEDDLSNFELKLLDRNVGAERTAINQYDCKAHGFLIQPGRRILPYCFPKYESYDSVTFTYPKINIFANYFSNWADWEYWKNVGFETSNYFKDISLDKIKNEFLTCYGWGESGSGQIYGGFMRKILSEHDYTFDQWQVYNFSDVYNKSLVSERSMLDSVGIAHNLSFQQNYWFYETKAGEFLNSSGNTEAVRINLNNSFCDYFKRDNSEADDPNTLDIISRLRANPCPDGYFVPSLRHWHEILATVKFTAKKSIFEELKLTLCGIRKNELNYLDEYSKPNQGVHFLGSKGYYWSSTKAPFHISSTNKFVGSRDWHAYYAYHSNREKKWVEVGFLPYHVVERYEGSTVRPSVNNLPSWDERIRYHSGQDSICFGVFGDDYNAEYFTDHGGHTGQSIWLGISIDEEENYSEVIINTDDCAAVRCMKHFPDDPFLRLQDEEVIDPTTNYPVYHPVENMKGQDLEVFDNLGSYYNRTSRNHYFIYSPTPLNTFAPVPRGYEPFMSTHYKPRDWEYNNHFTTGYDNELFLDNGNVDHQRKDFIVTGDDNHYDKGAILFQHIYITSDCTEKRNFLFMEIEDFTQQTMLYERSGDDYNPNK